MKSKINEKIEQINEYITNDIVRCIDTANPENLFNGLSGTALFLIHYYYYKNDSNTLELIERILHHTSESIENNEDLLMTYCSGLSGFCWLCTVLKKTDLINLDDSLIGPDINNLLFEYVKLDIQKRNYDYMHGALGYALYFLESKQSDKVDWIIDELYSIAVIDDDKMYWKYFDVVSNKLLDGVNIGMSHGVPSIISFLSIAFKEGYKSNQVKQMIRKATNYLLDNIQSPYDHGCYFGYSILDIKKEVNWSRLAWCYGDLGISACLFMASEVLNDPKLSNLSIEIALFCTTRNELANNSVDDAGICHGSSGIAYIFQYFYNKTHLSKFETAVNYWQGQTLKQSRFDHAPAGYKAFDSNKKVYYDTIGLLEGIAGIGLSLLSTVNAKQSNSWDRFLLLS